MNVRMMKFWLNSSWKDSSEDENWRVGEAGRCDAVVVISSCSKKLLKIGVISVLDIDE